MRITIETGTKPHSIKIEGHYTMDELIKFLSNLYPDFTWKDVQICDKLPDVRNGVWDQIINKNPIQSWPDTGLPYGSNPITYTGTPGTGYSAGSTLTTNLAPIQEYMEARGLISKK